MKGPSEGPRKREVDRRVHRAVPDVAPPPLGAPGVALGSDTEILQKLVRQLRLERSFLEAVLEQMPSGVTIAEAPAGRQILGNKRMETILREEFFPAQTVDQYDHWKAYRPNGRPYGPKEHPIARALLFGDTVRGELMRVRRRDGTDALLEVSAAPVRDEKGLVVAAVSTFQDVSDRDWASTAFRIPAPKSRKR